MLDPNLITTLEKSLQETRKAQSRLISRLREVEIEAERLREEIQALENGASQTESAIDGLLFAMRSTSRALAPDLNSPELKLPTKISTEPDRGLDLDKTSLRRQKKTVPKRYGLFSEPKDSGNVAYIDAGRASVPSRSNNIEAISHRFSDLTITQACTLLLREAGHPLHVNELYNLLVAGGMEFKGNNPTISIAVSLNRNRRFVKVEPGTFNLAFREVSRVAS